MAYKYTDRVTTREEGYFHISNSGFTFKLFEKEVVTDPNDGSEPDGPSVSWEAEIRLGAFGHGVSFRFPIVANMAEYFANVFGRLHHRMEELRATGDYTRVNGDGAHSSVNNVKVPLAEGVRFDEVLAKEGHADVQRYSCGGMKNGVSYNYIEYVLGDQRAKEGEGSELETKHRARMCRLAELAAPLHPILVLGGTYRPSKLKVQIREAVSEMAWTDSWSRGPERGEEAKAVIGDFFDKDPDAFWVYTPGFSLEKRKLILDRLGVTDPALRSRMLRGKA